MMQLQSGAFTFDTKRPFLCVQSSVRLQFYSLISRSPPSIHLDFLSWSSDRISATSRRMHPINQEMRCRWILNWLHTMRYRDFTWLWWWRWGLLCRCEFELCFGWNFNDELHTVKYPVKHSRSQTNLPLFRPYSFVQSISVVPSSSGN